jgi:hypothetical protein
VKELDDNESGNPGINEDSDMSIINDQLSFDMDGTNITEISIQQNENFITEQLAGVREVYDPGKLADLKKEENKDPYLTEAGFQGTNMLKNLDSIAAHSCVYAVSILNKVGTIINDVQGTISKPEFKKWRNDTFGSHQIRRLQQAQQIARMGDFSIKNAALGKNRLLELDRLRRDEGAISLLEENPLPDIAQDDEGARFKIHVDALVTWSRFKNEGIDFISFDQAALIASNRKQALELNLVKKLANKLNDPNTDKQEYFDNWLLNGCNWRNIDRSEKSTSISKLVAQFNILSNNFNMDDPAIFSDVKEEDIRSAYQTLIDLAGKLNIDLARSAE